MTRTRLQRDSVMARLKATNSCTIVIRPGESVEALSVYKRYVDGYICGTPAHLRRRADTGWLIIPVSEGAHRVVLRASDTKRIPRTESNTLVIALTAGHEVRLVAHLKEGALALSYDNGSQAAGSEPI